MAWLGFDRRVNGLVGVDLRVSSIEAYHGCRAFSEPGNHGGEKEESELSVTPVSTVSSVET